MKLPSFEQLHQVIRTLERESEFVHLVLMSADGEAQFLEVAEKDFRASLQAAFTGGKLALGLLGWENTEKGWQAKKGLFPWHQDAELGALSERLCDEAVESVEEAFREEAS